MKICAFADLHGNWPVFQAATPAILEEKADMNIFLGDVCGYYQDALKIIAELRSIPKLTALRGNHDDMFLRAAAGDREVREMYAAKYGPALEFFLGSEHREAIGWLSRTVLVYKDPAVRLHCSHGGPQAPLDEYVYPTDPDTRFCGLDAEWCLMGHTHYAMDRSAGGVRALNPGSLGQPRDGGWPKFVVIDTAARSAEFREVRFDKERFATEARSWAADHPYLADIWQRIR